MHVIPQSWSHLHILVTVLPSVGLVFVLGFYIAAMVADNELMKRSALVAFVILGLLTIPTYVSGEYSMELLSEDAKISKDLMSTHYGWGVASLVGFVICSILIVPTFVTGNASMWSVTDPPIQGISKAVINAHRDMAVWTLFGVAFTGVTAWIELFRFRHHARFSNRSLYLVLIFAIITLCIMAETGHRGGQINHQEIHVATDVLPTDPNAGLSPALESLINHVIWFTPWQTVHFFGFSLIFGTALAVSLRVLGFWKSVSFAAVHRLLPLGVFGVAMNVFSGMLILQQDSLRYLNNITFVPKVAFIAIGGIAVLYFSLSDRLWNLQAGEEAPMSAKWVAALVLIAWSGVIMGGRLLP